MPSNPQKRPIDDIKNEYDTNKKENNENNQ